MNLTCPACGEAATGRFCSRCGAHLEAPVTCGACGHRPPEGAHFCNQCGAGLRPEGASAAGARGTWGGAENAPVGAAVARNRAARWGWVVAGVGAGALAVALAIVLLADPEPEGSPPVTGPVGDPAAVDLASMTPRERADRLFNRVMRSEAAGDSAQVQMFLPMALAAYEMVPELDLDGHYHLAVLHLVAGDPSAARARADSILASEPNHLFGLFTAAQAEDAAGRPDAAVPLYRRFLEQYDAEIRRGLPEYRDHAQVLPVHRDYARRVVGSQ